MTILPAEYCPDCGRKLTTRPHEGDQQPYCEACDRMFWQQPIPCADAAVVDGDQVLLIKRALSPHEGTWTLPGGFIDSEESPAEAAARELHEETSVTVDSNDLVLFDTCNIATPVGWHNILISFAVTVEKTRGTLAAGTDAEAAQFWSLDELLDSDEKLRPTPGEETRIRAARETVEASRTQYNK